MQDLYDCQQTTNKKFLLSLGGDKNSGSYQLDNAADGEYLANFLWGAYGPYNSSWKDGPFKGIRPLDGGWYGTDGTHIDIDGFDFDIEKISPNQQEGYIACIKTLRDLFDAYKKKTGCTKEYLITGAPQCPRPDDSMSTMINQARFDIIWPQFYNNGQRGCTARNWTRGDGDFNFVDWASDLKTGASKDASLYIGLLGGASGSSGAPGDYLNPNEAKNLIDAFKSQPSFGGVMLWDAVASNDATDQLTNYKYVDGTPVPPGAAYYDVIKNYMGAPIVPYKSSSICTIPSSTSSSSTMTSSSTTSSAAVTTTSSSSSSSSSAAVTSTSSSAAVSTSSAAATTTSAPVIPTHVPSVGTCSRIGCYTEATNDRALTPFAFTDYVDMSPEICGALCPGYDYFGVEYGGECYCGNTINAGSTLMDDSECSFPCPGYPGELCGAGNRLDMYFCGTTSSSSSVTSSTSSAAVSSSSSAAVTTSTESSSSSRYVLWNANLLIDR